MGFVILDSNTGLKSAWEAAQSGVDDGGGDTHTPELLTPIDTFLRYYLKMSYDRNRDRIIVSNGDSRHDLLRFTYLTGSEHDADPNFGGDFNHAYHVAFEAGSFDPSSELNATEATRWLYPRDGACMQFTTDHNTGQFYGVNGLRYVAHPNIGVMYGQDYGGVPMALYELNHVIVLDNYEAIAFQGETIMPESGRVFYQTHLLATQQTFTQPVVLKGAPGVVLAPPVLMDNVIAFAFGYGPVFGSYIYAATRSGQWISSRPIRLSYVLGMAPIGVDRFIVVGSLSGGAFGGFIQPLTTFSFRYDRVRGSVILDDVSELNTSFEYRFPDHVGFMTFDSKRGALVLLSPDLSTVERHVFDVQCHPIAPTRMLRPVPVQPLHAGRSTRFVTATTKGAAPTQSRVITLDYGANVSSGNFTTFTGQTRTKARDGTAGFTVGLTSATEGQIINLTATTSSFSVVVSATTGVGQKYGNDPVALQSETANFEVSATLSAGAGTGSTTTSGTVVPRGPIFISDAGGGTPRELIYPDPSPFSTPLIYSINPQQWTNFYGIPLSRPFYKETQTLGKTVTTEYEKNDSDVEVIETWMGGGDRMSMPVNFLLALYDYFANPPDVVNQGYILWAPKDLTTVQFKVVIVGLSVGGAEDSMLFDNYSKQGVATIHDEVRLKLRLVEEV